MKILNKRKANIGSAKKLAKYHDIGSDNISSLSSNLDSSTSIQKNDKDDSWDDYQPTEDAYE